MLAVARHSKALLSTVECTNARTCRASASFVPFVDGLSSEVITTRSLTKLSSIPPSTSTVKFSVSTTAPATLLKLAEVWYASDRSARWELVQL